ncbi:protein of unknown function [Candidatus Methylomirabilis oxygeniifera]|uniref:Uncharacterized protein n=1 Tax=Methylomirabilis oxygeniifera TaxID=671143 RepID=D5MKH0_METO1|nr:protein of unknown function [Candidatus Methylomirabilis oxyfera]
MAEVTPMSLFRPQIPPVSPPRGGVDCNVLDGIIGTIYP